MESFPRHHHRRCSYSPPLVGGDLRDGAAALSDENESPQLRAEGENKFVTYDSEKVESQYFSGKKEK